MTTLARIGALLTAAATVALAFACESSTDPDDGAACHPGDRVRCECDAGVNGLSACINGRFAACECRATGTADPPDAAAPFDAGFGTFLGPCDASADCPEGQTCFGFTDKGPRCTRECTDDVQCEAPSPKCNPKRVCAIPD